MIVMFLGTGHSEPHAGLPQHTGLPRVDRIRPRSETAEAARANLGLGVHLDSDTWWLRSHDAFHTALPEPRPGREEVDREWTPPSF